MTDLALEAVNHSGIVCSEGYYLGNDSLCRPLCSLWVDPPGVGLTSESITIIVSAVTALFSSITAIVLALTTQKSTMYGYIILSSHIHTCIYIVNVYFFYV